MRYILVSAYLAVSLLGAELETQQAVEYTSRITERWTGTLHFRMRSKPTANRVYQARVGPVLQYDLTPKSRLLGGYYLTRVEPSSGKPWSSLHRVFGGGEHQWSRTRHMQFDTRSVIERYYSQANPAYSRFRQRFRLQSAGKVVPYAAYELFLDADGWRSARYIGGVRAPMKDSVSVDFGYFYETRRPSQGGNRHMIMTVIYFTGKRLRG